LPVKLNAAAKPRCCTAWLALVALALQICLFTVHSARHFDHLIGPFSMTEAAVAAAEGSTEAESPSPNTPTRHGFDHCAIDFGLAAAGHAMVAEPARIPLQSNFETAPLAAIGDAVPSAGRRYSPLLARAPPPIETSV
jgi:hypothetical protein